MARRDDVEMAYCPESGMVHRRLADGRWYPLDVTSVEGNDEPPAGARVLTDKEGEN